MCNGALFDGRLWHSSFITGHCFVTKAEGIAPSFALRHLASDLPGKTDHAVTPESGKGHNSAGEQALLREVTQEPDPVTLLAGVALRKHSQSDRGFMPS